MAEELVFGHSKISSGASATSSTHRSRAENWSPNGACPTSWARSSQASQEGYQAWVRPCARWAAPTPQADRREIKGLVEGGLSRARTVLSEQEDSYICSPSALLEYETLTGEESRH